MTKMLLIGEVAEKLNRVSHTIRQWERDKRLPKELMPHRDENGWRCWSEEQVEGLKKWLVEADIRPGKGLETTKTKIVIVGQANETSRT